MECSSLSFIAHNTMYFNESNVILSDKRVKLITALVVLPFRIKKSFINKQSKAKDGIDQLKKKVERYEEQLNYLKQGGQIELTRQPGYSHKVRDQFNRIRTLG